MLTLRDRWFRSGSLDDQNERRLLVDGAAAGLLNGVAVFLPVFLVRLGASNLQVGLVSALPALLAVALSLPIGEFLARRTTVVRWLTWARTLVWGSFPVIGLLPFFLSERLPEAILLVWGAVTVPQVLHVVAVNIVLGNVVEAQHRFRLLSRRWSVAALAAALAVAGIGYVLPRLDFPLGYQWIFISSALTTLICHRMMSGVRLPEAAPPAAALPLLETLRQRGRQLAGDRTFLRFILAQFVFSSGLQLTVPLLPLFWVREVQASDALISAINIAQILTATAAYFLWTRLARQWGKRWVLLISCLGLSFYPALTAFLPAAWMLVLWAALAGLFAAGVDLTFVDIMMSAGTVGLRPLYVGVYMVSANTAAFLAPLIGTALADQVGLGQALILGSGLRLAGVALIFLLGAGQGRSD